MQQRLTDRTTHKQLLQTFTSGMFQVKRASFLLANPRIARSSSAELHMVWNLLHLTVCRLSACKLLRTWSYSTSSTYLNYMTFHTFTHQAAVKKECWTRNTSLVPNASLFLTQKTSFIESNCSTVFYPWNVVLTKLPFSSFKRHTRLTVLSSCNNFNC